MSSVAAMNGAGAYIDPQAFRQRMTATLHRAFSCAKSVAKATGQTPRAAENQMAGLNTMQAHSLVNLMRASDEVLREVLLMAGRADLALTDAEQKRRMELAARILSGEDDA